MGRDPGWSRETGDSAELASLGGKQAVSTLWTRVPPRGAVWQSHLQFFWHCCSVTLRKMRLTLKKVPCPVPVPIRA